MPVRLIIFDLDGTLVDTCQDITNALNAALVPLGRGPLSVGETRALVGEGITRLIEKALGPEGQGRRDEAVGRFLDHYSAHLTDHSRPYPGAKDVLEKLPGVKKAVLSNKKEDLSRRLLEGLGLLGHFDLVAGSDTTPEKKPSPRAVQYVLQALGVGAREAMLVGDSDLDIEAGRAAGLSTVAAAYGYRGRDALRGADHLIEDIGELVPLLHCRGYIEDRRKEERFDVPDVFREYIELRVAAGEGPVKASLLDLSGHGMKLSLPAPLKVGSAYECALSAPLSLTREVSVTIRVRYVENRGGQYTAGAEIEKVHSELWFNVFKKILQFIAERKGEVF